MDFVRVTDWAVTAVDAVANVQHEVVAAVADDVVDRCLCWQFVAPDKLYQPMDHRSNENIDLLAAYIFDLKLLPLSTLDVLIYG